MKVVKIVITGGPCSGKSTALQRVKAHFEGLGYAVLVISEVATDLITGGVAPWTCGSAADYQALVLKLQLAKEAVFECAAEAMGAEKSLIVCDRGALDGKAYLNGEDFSQILKREGITETELFQRYRAVFHLVTAAKGSEEYYTVKNNPARTETAEQAALLDDNLLFVWKNHPQLHVIENAPSFDEKVACLVDAIERCLTSEDLK